MIRPTSGTETTAYTVLRSLRGFLLRPPFESPTLPHHQLIGLRMRRRGMSVHIAERRSTARVA